MRDQHLFEITITVDDDGNPAENPRKTKGSEFSCYYCGFEAELEEEGEEHAL